MLPERWRFPALLFAVFAVFVVLQGRWLHIDRRPVAVEMHYFAAARIAHALQGTVTGGGFPSHPPLSPYPPLIVYYTAPFLALFGIRADVAVLTLLPFAGLLMWATWQIARMYFTRESACVAAIAVLCFHHFLNREPSFPQYNFLNQYLLDLPLSAVVSLTLLLLLRIARGGTTGHTLALGLVLGCGALIRVNYALYLPVLLLSVCIEEKCGREFWKRLVKPVLLGAVVAAPWYGLHAPDLFNDFFRREFNWDCAARYGLPPILSFEGWTYYGPIVRSMLSWPLTLAALLGILGIALTRKKGWKLVLSGCVFSYVLLSCFYSKNARVALPCILFAAFGTAGLVETLRPRLHHLAALGITGWALLRMIHFAGALPVAHRLMEGDRTAVQPAATDWRVGDIMKDIVRTHDTNVALRISVVPFRLHFRHASFLQYALEHDLVVAADAEWQLRSDRWQEELDLSEFIITSDGDNGPGLFLPHKAEIEEWIRERRGTSVHRLACYRLPDGSEATLYRHDRQLPAWRYGQPSPARKPLVRFGPQVALSDYSLRREGEELVVTCEWQAMGTPRKEHRLFIHLRQDRRNVASPTFMPGKGLLPLHIWKQGLVINEEYRLALPREWKDQTYEVWIGWYRRFHRLPVRNAELPSFFNAVNLGHIAGGVVQVSTVSAEGDIPR
jgi:4-amino-4-deoxy-L-arabinose transferase-like glycosyltransferase